MSSSCCDPQPPQNTFGQKIRKDLLLRLSIILIAGCYILFYFDVQLSASLSKFSHDVVELMNSMWIGLGLAVLFVGLMDRLPREVIMGILGTNRGFNGLLRATAAGLLLDLCNHGILVVGMKFYERGASLGQTIAFLVASPWNSFSMTFILFALIGLKKTLLFILLSCLVALVSGYIFELLVRKQVLPDNKNTFDLPKDHKLWPDIKKYAKSADYSFTSIVSLLWLGLKSSKSILKWILFGTLMAATLRGFLSVEDFETYLGPSLLGLSLTVLGATIIEVCSEGSAPIAADLVNLGGATGNGFTFLMTGVSTDYTEIMSLRETTGSWKIALFLPLVTVPQIIFLGYLLNQ